MRWLGLVVLVSLALLGVGTGAGLALEERDSFCASCHTEPETAYVAQAQTVSGRSTTLAASHARLDAPSAAASFSPVKCIDCHGGVGLTGRAQTLFELGVGDTLAFVSGRAQQPARTTRPLPNANCARCHGAALAEPGFENHFHTKLAELQAPPLACVACHVSHSDQADPAQMYIRRAVVYPLCNECHARMGGPTNLR